MAAKTLTLPWPPSVNGYWRSVGGRQIMSKKARAYRKTVVDLVEPSSWPVFEATERLKVRYDVYPPDRRKRDISNLLKGMEDALTHAFVWEDDEQVDDIRIVRQRSEGKPGRVEVTIDVLEEG